VLVSRELIRKQQQQQHTTALASRYAARCDALIQIDDQLIYLDFFSYFMGGARRMKQHIARIIIDLEISQRVAY
jgi:hypothetical protein